MIQFPGIDRVVFDRVTRPDHLRLSKPGIDAITAACTSIGMLVDMPFT